jgi:choline dehydrogenase-like flavoprotein
MARVATLVWLSKPLCTTGNTQAPCVIIGERMAEILKAA